MRQSEALSLIDTSGRPGHCASVSDVQTVDGIHVLAFLLLGLTIARGVLAIAEHYFPSSDAVLAGRFIIGGAQ